MSESKHQHISTTIAYVLNDLQLREIIGISHDLRPAGKESWELVLPAILATYAPAWNQVLGLTNVNRFLNVGSKGCAMLGQLTNWDAASLNICLSRLSDQIQVPLIETRRILLGALIRRQCDLPVEQLLVVFGPEKSLLRIQASINAVRAMSLVG